MFPLLLNMYVALHFKSKSENQQHDISSIVLSHGKKTQTNVLFSPIELYVVFVPYLKYALSNESRVNLF